MHERINYPLHITLPKKEINTGYGVRLFEGQGIEHFIELAGKTGFNIVMKQPSKGWFFMELRKPVDIKGQE